MRNGIPQPHSLTRIRPGQTVEASGASVLVYKGGTEVRKTIKGFYQAKSGRLVLQEEGQGYNINAMLYTMETDILNQDVVLVNLPGTVGNFRVVNVEPKYDRKGVYSHSRISLEKDTAVIVS